MAKKKEEKDISKKIQKILDQVEKLTVLELSELVKALEDKFGVSAAPVAGPAAVGPAANGNNGEAEEKTEFDVVLTGFGQKKIQVIKAVRTLKPDIGLSDAKKLVESAPAPILEGANKEDAEKAQKKLEEAGAEIELK